MKIGNHSSHIARAFLSLLFRVFRYFFPTQFDKYSAPVNPAEIGESIPGITRSRNLQQIMILTSSITYVREYSCCCALPDLNQITSNLSSGAQRKREREREGGEEERDRERDR